MRLNWRFIKAFPKIVVVAVLIVGSSAIFAWWWFFRSPDKRLADEANRERNRAKTAETVVTVEGRLDHLVLINNSLYDLDTGTVYFKDWLEEGVPLALYLEPDRRSFLAQYPRGFIRYGLDGKRKQSLLHRYSLPFNKTHTTAFYCKDGDIWQAGIDWKELRFTDERKITQVGKFLDRSFAENLIFGTEKTLVVNLMGKLARIDLSTGAIKQVSYPLPNIDKRRSPNSRYFVLYDRGKLVCHDIDTEDSKIVDMAQGAFADCQWLNDDRCVLLSSGNRVTLYERLKNSIEEIAVLPITANRIAAPSPDLDSVLCSNPNMVMAVNLEKKGVSVLENGNGYTWIGPDNLLFSRDTLDTSKRGTWLWRSASPARRLLDKPFLVTKSAAQIWRLKELDITLVGVESGLMRLNKEGYPIGLLPHVSSDLNTRLIELRRWASLNHNH